MFKDEQGSFKVNGIDYKLVADDMYGEYENNGSTFLNVTLTAAPNEKNQVQIRLDLSKIGVAVSIDSASQNFFYNGLTTGTYFPISGEWKITSRKEGNPLTRHTEGTFSFVGVDMFNTTDTVRITDGYFYVNNY